MSDLRQAAHEFADAQYDRAYYAGGLGDVFLDRHDAAQDRLLALIERAERIETAADALNEALFDSINNSRIPARIRNLHIDIGNALAPVVTEDQP